MVRLAELVVMLMSPVMPLVPLITLNTALLGSSARQAAIAAALFWVGM